MKFSFTPVEGQAVARAVARHFRRRGMRVDVEAAVTSDAPYRTSLVVVAPYGLRLLVECQGAVVFGEAIKNLSRWLGDERRYVELYLATASDAVLRAGMLEEIRKGGVGLLIVDEDGNVSVAQKARNPALVVTPDPTLRYGASGAEVREAVKKFNETDRRDGLRDMCDLVERETERLALRAARRGWLQRDAHTIQSMSWSDKINLLAANSAYKPGRTPRISPGFKDDLHSFRNARNLVDHPARGRREDARRQRQFAERMVQGPRLVAELMSLRRGIR